jgi:GT2 family glycosyltransferase
MNAATPEIAVIVPVHNGAGTLGDCLTALAASTFRDFETIVVDDGSSDGSATIAERFPVRLVRLKHNCGAAAARNAGVAVSSAPLLFFLDADIVVPPEFLAGVRDALRGLTEHGALFCSYTKETLPRDVFSRHKNLVHHWTHQTGSPEAATFCGGFGLIRREVFQSVGGFDPDRRFLEDIDLGYRLYRAGHRIFLAKHLQATHAKAYTLGSLWRSELFGRAVPWTRLMIEHRIFRNDLNTRVSSVFSVLTACALPVSVLVDPRLRIAGVLALLFLWLNRAFLRLSAREYGFFFAVRSAGLCWLSCLASALGACLGAGTWLWDACCNGAGKLLALARGF